MEHHLMTRIQTAQCQRCRARNSLATAHSCWWIFMNIESSFRHLHTSVLCIFIHERPRSQSADDIGIMQIRLSKYDENIPTNLCVVLIITKFVKRLGWIEITQGGHTNYTSKTFVLFSRTATMKDSIHKQRQRQTADYQEIFLTIHQAKRKRVCRLGIKIYLLT